LGEAKKPVRPIEEKGTCTPKERGFLGRRKGKSSFEEKDQMLPKESHHHHGVESPGKEKALRKMGRLKEKRVSYPEKKKEGGISGIKIKLYRGGIHRGQPMPAQKWVIQRRGEREHRKIAERGPPSRAQLGALGLQKGDENRKDPTRKKKFETDLG